jgi:DNA uptake protein ComE-like DNA-binding protein
MSRITWITLALALGLLSAPLAYGDGASGGSTAATPAMSQKAPEKHKSSSKTTKVDLNSASREELEKLPGLNEATAEKIIAARPLKSTHDLVSKSIVTQTEFNKLSSHVMTKPIAAK